MVTQQARAIKPEDKEERRQSILDAARRVLLANPERLASVEEVAAAAGLAKGTVYLYFPSKEAILLALHEMQVAAFFADMTGRAGADGPMTIDVMNALVRDHMVLSPTFLPVATVCFAWQEQGVPAANVLEFKVHVARLMASASEALAPHFPQLGAAAIHELLLHSYGLIIGLWHLLRPATRLPETAEHPEIAHLQPDYGNALEAALRALWLGRIAIHAPAAVAPPTPRPARRKH